MEITLTMPQPGETITQGLVVRWLVKPGDVVSEGQSVVELETEKTVFEYESPYAGTVKELLVKENTSVPVGIPIAVYEVEDAKAKSYRMLGMGADQKKPPSSDAPVHSSAVCTSAPSQQTEHESAVPLSPYVRAKAREHGLSESQTALIPGTGPKGRVTKEDLLQFLDKPVASAPAVIAAPSLEMERVPCSPIRLRIAENMVASKRVVPHAHTGVSIDVTRLVEYRAKAREDFEKKNGVTLGVLPMLMPTLRHAVRAYPMVNAQFLERDKEIGLFKNLNLGVAIDTERGLYTPVVHGADKMSFLEFTRQLDAVMERARQNKLKPSDMTGMTFTFNNFGYFGTTLGIQVVPPGQATILGMGRIEKRPWVVADRIEIRYVAEFVMAFDHRVLDGRDAGLFLHAIKKSLENFDEIDLVG